MIHQLLPLATGVVTLVAMWLCGSGRWQGWALGLANQGLWLAFIIAFDAWGLLPLLVALCFVYTRNLVRWRQGEAASFGDAARAERADEVPGHPAMAVTFPALADWVAVSGRCSDPRCACSMVPSDS